MAGLVFWAPLPFGSVVPWAQTVLQIGVFVAAALALAELRRPRHLLPVAGSVSALVAIAALGLLQAQAWPSGLVALISPTHAEAYRAASELAGEALPHTLSLAPHASRAAALQWLTIAACLVAAVVIGRKREQRRVIFGAILLAGLFEVFYGARGRVAGTADVWGTLLGSGPGRMRGTFVNPDHFALYLEICLAIAFGWSWWMIRRTRREPRAERRLMLVGLPLLCWFVFFVGLAYSGSRAGLVAAILGVIVQSLLLAVVHRRWSIAPIGVGVAALGLAAVTLVGLQGGLGRWLATSAYELSWNERFVAYAETLRIWFEYPLLGSGLGTFRDAFPSVQPAALTGTVWRHAHSAPLELLATIGALGAALALAGSGWLLARQWRVLKESPRTEGCAAALAALGSCVSVGFHECFDFGLTMPANAVTFAVVLGLGAGARLGKVVAKPY